ncbi:MAG: hypothetical protein HOD58_09345, partial [Gammaproteobacteria bacterium]|nr:hypothetical protein [Gammaproteobacteria bacterium]
MHSSDSQLDEKRTMTIEVTVPDIGDFEGVEVIELLVTIGDTITKEDS